MKISGMRAVQAVREAMEQAGLGRTSGYSGGELTGWLQPNHYGSTGFSVRKEKDGSLGWHVVISGKPHLAYRTWTEHEDNGTIELHEPKNPERLYDKVRAVFESLGIAVARVDFGGAQMHWDDDCSYNVATAHPEWLGPADPSNRPQRSDAPMLRAMVFDERMNSTAPALAAPLVGYVVADASYLTRESLVALQAASEKREASRQETVARYAKANMRLPRELAVRGLAASLSGDGEFVLSVPGKTEVRVRPVSMTNHWGDEVEAWKMPHGVMKAQHAFKPGVPFVLDGERRDSVPFMTWDAQHGGDAPWLEEAPAAPSPR